MAALKALVIIMGALIVVGTGGLIYVIATRMQTTQAPIAATIALPPGAKLTGMTGWGERLVLRASGPDDREQLLVVDPLHDRVLGVVTVAPAAAP